ncbi:MAG: alpha/beta fold hydrolase [Solirubrobacteraceae bacterium]
MPSIGEFTVQHRGGAGSPMVCLHGFTDTWRTWELVLPALERRHEVFAPTLAGHRGGPPLAQVSDDALTDAVQAAMDAAGIESAHLVGNSLGGYLALRLAARGRALSVVALAPAGGWPADDLVLRRRIARQFQLNQDLVSNAAPFATMITSTRQGRRRATELICVNFEHLPAELIAHQIVGAAGCTAARPLIAYWLRQGWELDAERITCPVRIIWGAADRVLPWPAAAERHRNEWLPNADWIVLDDVGHCPQLDVPTETAQLILDFTA